MKIKSPYSNTFGMYCLLPFHSMTVNFDEKHLTFWILGNAFYGTPGSTALSMLNAYWVTNSHYWYLVYLQLMINI